MFEIQFAKLSERLPRWASRQRLLFWSIFSVMQLAINASSLASSKDLPVGGTTNWEIQEMEVIVTFLLFDPEDPAVTVPRGLRLIPVSEIDAPEFQAHLKQHPEHADWVFSFIEFARPNAWILDGKAPKYPENGGVGVWFAPVDHSQLAAEIPKEKYDSVIAPSPDAVLVLGLWIPDSAYVDFMRARGHHAEYGMVTVVKDSNGTYHGEIQLADLNVMGSATPHGEASLEPDPFTQVFFVPGRSVKNVVILAGANVRERECRAEWSRKGDHPVARGVVVGPTFQVFEGPLTGSAYRIADE